MEWELLSCTGLVGKLAVSCPSSLYMKDVKLKAHPSRLPGVSPHALLYPLSSLCQSCVFLGPQMLLLGPEVMGESRLRPQAFM